MRLSSYEINTIKEVVATFDSHAKLILFGSRVDDCIAGGDIDLLVISDSIDLQKKLHIRMMLKDRLGDQKIDLLISKALDTAFLRKAYSTGVEL